MSASIMCLGIAEIFSDNVLKLRMNLFRDQNDNVTEDIGSELFQIIVNVVEFRKILKILKIQNSRTALLLYELFAREPG